MAKGFAVVAVLAFAICASGLLASAHGTEKEEFTISGLAYCDTCRVEFQTKLSFPLSGVKVGLECFNETTNKVTLKTETVTDNNGSYKLKVPGDHDEEVCEVALLESIHPSCNQVVPGSIRSDRVPLTNKNGIFGYARFANVLSFATKEFHPDCPKVLLDMGLLPEDVPAKLSLKCKNENTDKITLETTAETNKNGAYRIVVDDDHDEEMCRVFLVESGDPECRELLKAIVHSDGVSLTKKNDITQLDRYANPLGLAKKKALPNCTLVLVDKSVFRDNFFEHY